MECKIFSYLMHVLEQHCKPKSFTRLHGPLIFLYHTEIDVPIFEVCAVYDIQNKTLQMIESSWTEVVRVNKLTWRFLATDSTFRHVESSLILRPPQSLLSMCMYNNTQK